MLLQLGHKKLMVYRAVCELVKEVYTFSNCLPADEKFNMVQQIRRAALSVKLNLAEGASKKSEAERKRYYEIARGSVVEIDAAVETSLDLGYVEEVQLLNLSEHLNKCFAMLSKLIH
jgi:four helix bundle protein